MSKVICDVCGTSFPETSAQCPICGSAANGDAAATVGAESAAEAGSGYNYVRGGRFSKGNVRKINEGNPPRERRNPDPARSENPRRERPASRDSRRSQTPQKENSNKGLVIVVLILLLAIVAVCIYIGVRFFAPTPDPTPDNTQGSQQTQGTQQTDPSSEPDPTDSVPCTDIQLSGTIIEFTDPERSQLLSVVLEPSDTTDELTFTSSDESVVTVSESGIITPVGDGEATITVTCGDIVKECSVRCSLVTGGGDPDTPTEPDSNPSFVSIILKGGWANANGIRDITLDKPGKVFNIYDSASTVSAEEITWVSKNPSIATVNNGKVTAISKGKTEIHASYGDVKVYVIIRCNWADGTPPETQATQATQAPTTSGSTIVVNPNPMMNRKDFTLSGVGKTWDLYKGTDLSETLDADQIEWSSADESVCTIVNGVVTATGAGETKVYGKHGDEAYECIVRVK